MCCVCQVLRARMPSVAIIVASQQLGRFALRVQTHPCLDPQNIIIYRHPCTQLITGDAVRTQRASPRKKIVSRTLQFA